MLREVVELFLRIVTAPRISTTNRAMAEIAHVEDVTQLAADGAEHGSDSGEDVPALVAPVAAAEAANEDDTGSNMGALGFAEA